MKMFSVRFFVIMLVSSLITFSGMGNIAEPLRANNPCTDQDQVNFRASGTEPFWGLEITDKQFRFTSMVEGYSGFTAPFVQPIRAMDANVKMYRSQSAQGEIKIQVMQGSCSDNMSEKTYAYQVTIEIKRSADKEFKTFKGCGTNTGEYRLHDIWVLEAMNTQQITVARFGKERPRIEINASEKAFLGYTGSRDFKGKIFTEPGVLKFTGIKVPAGAGKAEVGFIKTLESVTTYKIEKNKLILSNPAGELLRFRKTD